MRHDSRSIVVHGRWTQIARIGIAIVAAPVMAIGPASAQAETPETDAALVAPSEQGNEGTAQKKLWVRGFSNGIKPVAASIHPGAVDFQADRPRIVAQYPDWLKKEELLGSLPAGDVVVHLLWRAEALPATAPSGLQVALKLANHQGYAALPQRDERTPLDLSGQAKGPEQWSEHKYGPLAAYPPGLYDLILSNTTLPRETIPLGQALWDGQPVSRDETLAQLRELYPTGACAFGGIAVLARWYRFELPMRDLGFVPKTLVIVSSADWLESSADMTPVARIGLTHGGKEVSTKELDLGRDTSSTWFNFHARGSVKHSQAPIAWSWRERQESVDFEANAYAARFDLAGLSEKPDAITIHFVGEEGVLRVYGVILLL